MAMGADTFPPPLVRELEIKEEKERKKKEAAEERARKEAEKQAAAKIAPEDMFRMDPEYAGYSFDETGLPIKDPGLGRRVMSCKSRQSPLSFCQTATS
jgi:hypothetical protein